MCLSLRGRTLIEYDLIYMWPFKTKVSSLEESRVFDGFIDWHSHILPGVDDGIRTIADSLRVLDEYQRLGFRKVWLTPHVMEDYPNEPDVLRCRFEELKAAWNGTVQLGLASENMLDTVFEERLERDSFLPLGDEGSHLLVETSYYTPPMDMDGMIEGSMKKGYFIVLAHPERYRYMEKSDFRKWKDMGVLFQCNLLSLAGGYGENARAKAEWLLENGMADMYGTDIHRLDNFKRQIGMPLRKKKHIEMLLDVMRKDIGI